MRYTTQTKSVQLIRLSRKHMTSRGEWYALPETGFVELHKYDPMSGTRKRRGNRKVIRICGFHTARFWRRFRHSIQSREAQQRYQGFQAGIKKLEGLAVYKARWSSSEQRKPSCSVLSTIESVHQTHSWTMWSTKSSGTSSQVILYFNNGFDPTLTSFDTRK